jgi:hypothetical protein
MLKGTGRVGMGVQSPLPSPGVQSKTGRPRGMAGRAGIGTGREGIEKQLVLAVGGAPRRTARRAGGRARTSARITTTNFSRAAIAVSPSWETI